MARQGLDNAIDGHTIESIAFILDKDRIIAEKWSELATHLGIAPHRIRKFREDVRLDKITHADLISGILELWKGQVGSAARFDKLNAAVTELGAVNVKESLEALQSTAEIENYSRPYVRALQQELLGLQTKNFGLTRELVSKSNIIERKDKEIELLSNEYQNLLHEKGAKCKALEEELLVLRSQITVQQCQLSETKTLNGNQSREIAGLKDELIKAGQEKIRCDEAIARLESGNAKLEKKNGEKEHEFIKSEQEITKLVATGAFLKTDNDNLTLNIKVEENSLAKHKMLYFKNEIWDSELHLAVNRMDESAIHRLVENGADLEATNKKLETPLYRASLIKDKTTGLKIIKYLIDKGANAYAKNNVNLNFLHILVADGKSLTPSQFHDIVTYIVNNNLTSLFNTPGYYHPHIPLHRAVRNIEVTYETLLLLKENGANFDYLDSYGNSILHYPLWGKRSIKLISDLVQLGADWTLLNNNGRSLLHIAAEYCHVAGVKYFINKDLEVTALDTCRSTPLHRVVQYGKGDIVTTVGVLIKNGANLEIKNAYGKTPLDLWLAKGNENKELVQMLTFDK